MISFSPVCPSWPLRLYIGQLLGLILLCQATTVIASDRGKNGLVGPVHVVVKRLIHWKDVMPVRVTRTLYDRERRVLEVQSTEEINSKIKLTGKVRYEYDHTGHPIKMVVTGEDGSVSRTTSFFYDEQGNKVEEIVRDSNGLEELHFLYTWDRKGNLTEWKNVQPEGQPIWRWIGEYDDQGHTVKAKIYKADGILESILLRKYDKIGLVKEAIDLDSTESVTHRDVYNYDSSGRNVERLEYDAKGILSFKTTFTYENDSRGNWITKKPERWSYDKSGKEEKFPTEVITRKITYYK